MRRILIITAVVAAVLVASAQAAPRDYYLYANGAKLPEGANTSVLVWGSPTLTDSAGTWTCETVAIGHIKNGPSGGVGTFGDYQAPFCEAPQCGTESLAPMVHRSPEASWPVWAPEASEPTLDIEVPGLEVGCKGGFVRKTAGSVSAAMVNGATIGASPARLRVTSSSLSEGVTMSGAFKMMGFEGGEVVALKP